jgi:branched-chain amino acid transport system substrate-binding protein
MLIFVDGTAGPGLGPELTWIFRPHITAYERALASTTWMKKNKPEIKTVALLGADSEGGHFDNKTFREFVEALTDWGIKSEDYYAMGTKDYYSLLTKILSGAAPDLIFTDTATPGDLGLIIKQSRELGYNGIILNNTTVDIGDIVRIAGVKNAENVYLPNYSREMTPAMKELTDAYFAKYKEHNDLVMFIADAVPIFVQALQGAGSIEKEAVKAYLESGASFKSHMGPDGFFYGKEIPHYGIDHQFLAATPVARIHNGQVDVVGVVPPKELLAMVKEYLKTR